MHGEGGHAWQGGGHAWQRGACVVKGSMCGEREGMHGKGECVGRVHGRGHACRRHGH